MGPPVPAARLSQAEIDSIYANLNTYRDDADTLLDAVKTLKSSVSRLRSGLNMSEDERKRLEEQVRILNDQVTAATSAANAVLAGGVPPGFVTIEDYNKQSKILSETSTGMNLFHNHSIHLANETSRLFYYMLWPELRDDSFESEYGFWSKQMYPQNYPGDSFAERVIRDQIAHFRDHVARADAGKTTLKEVQACRSCR